MPVESYTPEKLSHDINDITASKGLGCWGSSVVCPPKQRIVGPTESNPGSHHSFP